MSCRLRIDYVKKPQTLANQGPSFGAGEMNRTPDLLITNELLYRLSYTGFFLNSAFDYSQPWKFALLQRDGR